MNDLLKTIREDIGFPLDPDDARYFEERKVALQRGGAVGEEITCLAWSDTMARILERQIVGTETIPRQTITDALAALRESIGINGAQALAHIDTTIAALGLAPEEDK